MGNRNSIYDPNLFLAMFQGKKKKKPKQGEICNFVYIYNSDVTGH